jgi:hypothetical protein
MGAGQSIRLDRNSDGCKIPEITRNIKGLSSDSASPSDTWLIDTVNNVYYEDQKIDKIFVKYFINPKTLIDYKNSYPVINRLTMQNRQSIIETTSGMEYELRVYRDIIRPLIDYRICDNFVKYMGSGINCKYNSLFNALKKTGKLSDNEIVNNLQRTVTFMSNNMQARPSTTDDLSLAPMATYFDINAKTAEYMFILSDVVNGEKMYDYLKVRNFQIEDDLLFQFVFGCYAMYCSHMIHNDLHSNNFWVVKRDQPELVTYVYGEDRKTCSFYTKYKVLIFDFDRAYCESLGENPILGKNTDVLCMNSGQCNQLIQLKDLWKMFASLIQNHHLHGKGYKYAEIFCGSDKSKQEKFLRYMQADRDHSAFWIKYNNRQLTKTEIEFFGGYEDILFNIQKYMLQGRKLQQSTGHINECRKSMFDVKGRLVKPPNLNIDRQNYNQKLDNYNNDKRELNRMITTLKNKNSLYKKERDFYYSKYEEIKSEGEKLYKDCEDIKSKTELYKVEGQKYYDMSEKLTNELENLKLSYQQLLEQANQMKSYIDNMNKQNVLEYGDNSMDVDE